MYSIFKKQSQASSYGILYYIIIIINMKKETFALQRSPLAARMGQRQLANGVRHEQTSARQSP
jgi:hypothetical protein